MICKKLKDFIKIQDERLRKQFDWFNETTRVFVRTIKINEEVGELCEAILGKANIQRNEKANNQSDVSEEIADVLITTFLLAEIMKVDVDKALKDKIEKINKRYSEQK